MLFFLLVFFFFVIPIVIVGAIVYGIHKIITGIIKRRKFAKRFEDTNRANQQRENSRFEDTNRANQQRENSRFEDTNRANQQRENSRFEDPTGEYSPQREISRAEAYEKLCIAKHSMGLSITATIEQAHQKYRELAKEWHPDVNPHPQAAQKFMEVKQAYETILELNQQVV